MANFPLSPPPDPARYVLANVHIPPALCALKPGPDGWCIGDILIENGTVTLVAEAETQETDLPITDARGCIVLSGLVDCHTHLDKAHVAAFEDFIPGDLASAITAMRDNKRGWTPESLEARVEFSLSSAFAYGVRALRSHVDCAPGNPDFVYGVMQAAQTRWRGRIDLQLSTLAGIAAFEDAPFCRDIFRIAGQQGRFGAFLFDQPDLKQRLIPLFEVAQANGWDLDFHVDEGLDPGLNGLEVVAQLVLESGFRGRVLCGHFAALSIYEPMRRDRVIAQAIAAGLHFVALPSSNLYLQSRNADNVPTMRGMGPVARLAARGGKVALGADNVRDGFCAFGDFDPMAVLNLGAQVGHLHEPARDWSGLVTTNPAEAMGLEWSGRIGAGVPADLVLFGARTSGEMNLRGVPERVVIRGGAWLDVAPPAFSELVEQGG